MNDVQAVVLAGGLGTRLRPLTVQFPKVMAPIHGAPFLEHVIRMLKGKGIRRYLLLVAYLHEQVQEYFGDGSRHDVSVEYSVEPERRGTGGALRLALPRLDSRFLLLNGDTYLDTDYDALIRLAAAAETEGTIGVYQGQDTKAHWNVHLSAGGAVTRYDKQNPAGANGVDAGVGVFRRDVVAAIPESQIVSFEETIFPRLIARGQLTGRLITDRYYDIGTFERLALFQERG